MLAVVVRGARRRARAAAVRRHARRGLRAHVAGLRRPALQPARLRPRRGDGDRGDAHGRTAAGQRPHGGAGGDRAAVRARLPLHAARGDGRSAPWPPWPGCSSRRPVAGGPGPTIVLLALAGFACRPRSVWCCAAGGSAPASHWRSPVRPIPSRRAPPFRRRHAHQHGPAADTSRSSTTTTSTTCTTATATRSTEVTMTSTEPGPGRHPGNRRPARGRPAPPGSGAPSRPRCRPSTTSAQRPGDPRPAPAAAARTSGSRRSTARCRRSPTRHEVDVLRTEDGEALYRQCSDAPPPPPGVPRLRRDGRDRGADRGALGERGRRRSTATPTSATRWRSSGAARPARLSAAAPLSRAGRRRRSAGRDAA